MQNEYFYYLNQIKLTGKLYRKFFVYPLIKFYTNGKILDVGCGTGLFLESCKEAIGVDVNELCVEYCRKKQLEVFKMDYDVLPFIDDFVDTIVLDNVLEHISDPVPLIRECKRILNPNGRIIVLVPGSKGYKHDPDHKHYYSKAELRYFLKEHSFSVLKEKSIPIPGLEKILTPFCFFIVGEINV